MGYDPSGYYDIREFGYGGFGGIGGGGDGGGGGGSVVKELVKGILTPLVIALSAEAIVSLQTDGLRDEKFAMYHAGLLVISTVADVVVKSIIEDEIAAEKEKVIALPKDDSAGK